MMRPQPKRRHKCRTSKQYCQEKLSCLEVTSEAVYYCNDCNSAQCQNCEKDIHTRKVSFEFHDRRTIEPPPKNLLCQCAYFNLDCKDRNFADLWCEICRITFCFECFEEYHKNKKQQHISVSFTHHQKRESDAKAAATLDEVTLLTIKPTSPLFGVEDDTLTFCSFPQEQVSLKLDTLTQDDFASAKMTMTGTHLQSSTASSGHSMPDLCPGGELDMLSSKLEEAGLDSSEIESAFKEADNAAHRRSFTSTRSFLLVDDREELQVKDADTFLQKLGCSKDAQVKVVSVFGNTGDGKSYTLNHTFFGGEEVFQTSECQNSCTVGVWAAYDQCNNVIAVDTEGLLGSSANDNKRTRLLLKIIAVSDLVVFRTRAERLHKDMFVFLSNASKAYKKHFAKELQAASERFKIEKSNLGPILLVFQETTHTEPLQGEKGRRADAHLRDLFFKNNFETDAFSEICYVGTKTSQPPTDFSGFLNVLLSKLQDNSVRAPRKPCIMFHSLKVVNDKFNGKIDVVQLDTFPEEYFTCMSKCLACGSRCVRTMNHVTEHEPHEAAKDIACKFENQFGNKVYLCKKCKLEGRSNIVVPKTSEASDNAWIGFTKYIVSGYVMECPTCGVIYRSREHWYGNPDPESCVYVEVRHIWPEGIRALYGTHNAARKVIDSFGFVAEAVSSVGAKPARLLKEWTADQIAPPYWVPNSQITHCKQCGMTFTDNDQKHHCRACGFGFCDACSSKKRMVPERGWNDGPVRVCDTCFAGNGEASDAVDTEKAVTARKVGEVVSCTIGVLASALDYPKSMLKDSARPEYWIPDDQIEKCCVCEQPFNLKRPIHHCRACGDGVCAECSPGKKEVPFRGWDYPVRICTKCESRTDVL